MDIYLDSNCYGGVNYYRVMVDGRPYDEFLSDRVLTWSEEADITSGYREALDGYALI